MLKPDNPFLLPQNIKARTRGLGVRDLSTVVLNRQSFGQKRPLLEEEELVSLIYHDLFDFPLTLGELIKWRAGERAILLRDRINPRQQRGYFFLEGKEGLISKRLIKKRVSHKKIKIAQRAAAFLAFIPTIKMIGLTGSLAMGNASRDADIDFIVIVKHGYLWLTRLFAFVWLKLGGFSVRRFADRKQKDKICLNIWLDEQDLLWSEKDRNIYTAHEIAQIVPLVNKRGTYEKFVIENEWAKDYWPNALKIRRRQSISSGGKLEQGWSLVWKGLFFILQPLELWARRWQIKYMRRKVTREIVTPTRAIFHPINGGEIVVSSLKKYFRIM